MYLQNRSDKGYEISKLLVTQIMNLIKKAEPQSDARLYEVFIETVLNKSVDGELSYEDIKSFIYVLLFLDEQQTKTIRNALGKLGSKN